MAPLDQYREALTYLRVAEGRLRVAQERQAKLHDMANAIYEQAWRTRSEATQLVIKAEAEVRSAWEGAEGARLRLTEEEQERARRE